MSNRGARRRGPHPARRGVGSPDPDELLVVVADYHRTPLGAWSVIVAPDGLEPLAWETPSVHDAFHDTMDLIEALSVETDVSISTLHTLDGDPAAWITLTAKEGFLDCAEPGALLTRG